MPLKINGATSGSVTLNAPNTGTDVSINIANPTFPNNVVIKPNSVGGLELNQGNTNQSGYVSFLNNASSRIGYIGWAGSDSGNLEITTDTSTNLGMKLITNGLERMKIDSSGKITTQVQPYFHVGRSAGDVPINTVIVCNDVYVNRGSHFNTTTGRFTAPVSGVYHFYAKIMYNALDPSYASIRVNGSNYSQDYQESRPNYTGWQNSHMRLTITLAPGDYVDIYNGNKGAAYGQTILHTYFGGWLLG